MSNIAKFNIGGQRYEVSRSLLEEYPNTLLTTSASERWQKNEDAEIFIERNGLRFQYVLDYLRDGTVDLPPTESRNAVLKELEYYGVTDIDEEVISETTHKRCSAAFLEGLHILHVAVDITNKSLKKYLGNSKETYHYSTEGKSKHISVSNWEYSSYYVNLNNEGQNILQKKCNEILGPYGLNVTCITCNGSYLRVYLEVADAAGL